MAASYKITDNNGILTTPNHKINFDSKGAGYELFTHLKKYTHKILQVDGYTGQEDTYGSVLERSIRIALKLKEYGIKPSDTIAICTSNHLNSSVSVFASLFVGAKVTCFDNHMHHNEAAILVRQVEPKIAFVCSESLDFMEQILKAFDRNPTIIVFGPTSTFINFFDLLQPCAEEQTFTPSEVDENETAFIFFSSGTTGLPKGVCLSHRAFLEQVAVGLEYPEPFERVLMFSSLFWSTNIFFWGVAVLSGYSRVVMNFDDDMGPIWNGIEKYKPTYMFLTPFKMRTLCNAKTPEMKGDSFKKIYIGGGPIFDHELKKYRNMFPKAVVSRGYGLTEAGLVLYFPTSTEEDLKYLNEKETAVGRLLNAFSCKVVDVKTEKVLRHHQKGELRLKTKGALTEYYKIDSSNIFDSDGWFKTGDIVYYDEDYYFYYVERLKELIKYRGWHVQPRMIENVLLARPDVSAACVFGIPHELDEEHPMAVVQLKSGYTITEGLEDAICRYVEEQLGNNFKLRAGVKIVENIPISANGKYDVRTLKDQVLNLE